MCIVYMAYITVIRGALMLATATDGVMAILECDGNASSAPGSKVVISSTCCYCCCS